jgi:Ni/Fe-hydrogenase subunit HybB-like protein
LFLLSAFAVGYPMVVVETTIATSSLKLESETPVLARLIRFTILTLGLYMAIKFWDLADRGAFIYLWDGSGRSIAFLAETGLGVVLPWVMLLFPGVRASRRALFTVCLFIVAGVLLNRINVFITAFTPPFANHSYYPAMGEILVTAGCAATIMFLYRIGVTYLPVLSARRIEEVES